MKAAIAPAWAVSFADLCMLLLGFFVVLHAQSSQQSKVVSGIKQAFGQVLQVVRHRSSRGWAVLWAIYAQGAQGEMAAAALKSGALFAIRRISTRCRAFTMRGPWLTNAQ